MGRQLTNVTVDGGFIAPLGPIEAEELRWYLEKFQSKKGMIQKLLRHKDPRWTWKLMCNRWPEEFRDRVATEISGPNGVPLMPQNPFKVEIRLADSEEIQTDFEVEQPDGSISHVHYDPYGLERQREARRQQKDATS